MISILRAVVLASLPMFFVLPAQAADIDIPYESFTLQNGLRVVVHEDRKAPIVAVSIWYGVGSKDEPEGKTGFAHLFEHLMFNGSENHDREYFEPLEEVGATAMNGTTWFDRTNYFQNVPTPALELALWLESDRMGHLLGVVTQEKLDNQRGVVQNEKRQGDNQPYGKSQYRILAGLYPEAHPYRHSTIGSMADLDAASLEDVHEWFKTYYGPNNAVLVLAGDIDADTAKPMVEKYFGDIPAGPPLAKMQSWVPRRDENIYDSMTDRVSQTRIIRAWNAADRSDPDAVLLTLAATVLAYGKNSPLYRELVYEKQLATSVNAYLESHELASVFTIRMDVKNGVDPVAAEAALDRLVAEFLAKGPKKSALERARIALIAGFIRGLEEIGGFSGKAAVLAEGALYENDPAHYKRELELLETAKPGDVKAAAERWLSSGYYQLRIDPFAEYQVAQEGADRTALPQVTDTPDLRFPAIEQATLSNGIPVLLAERHAVPLVEVALLFDAGYSRDHGGKLGLASFTAEMLDEGTTNRNALEISDEKDRLGAQISSAATLESTLVSLSALKQNLGPSLDLLADIARNPAFDDREIERLRQLRAARIAREKTQPVSIALRELPPLIYGDNHPYGIPFTGSGTEQSNAEITREDMLAFARAWLRPDNLTLLVVGDTNLEEMLPLLESRFGNWRGEGQKPASPVVPEIELPQAGKLLIIDRPQSEQSLILAGHVAPPTRDERTLVIDAMNDVIGGEFTARVNMNLREDKGWAYGAYTILYNARAQRPFFVYAPVQTDKTADSVAELIRELSDFVGARPVSDGEAARVINNNSRKMPGQFETSRAVMAALIDNVTYGRAPDYHASIPERLTALNARVMSETAKDVIKPTQLLWLVIGDRARIEAPLRELGLIPVEVVEQP